MVVVNLNITSIKGNLCCFISCLSLAWNSFGQNTRLKFHVVKLIVKLPIYLIVYRTVYSIIIYTSTGIKWKKFDSRATKKKELNMHSDLTITEKYTVDYKKIMVWLNLMLDAFRSCTHFYQVILDKNNFYRIFF